MKRIIPNQAEEGRAAKRFKANPNTTQGERAKALEEIKKAHTEALTLFQENNFKNAELELIKVLRPVLSKSEMKSLYVDVKDVLEETLSALYHLGLIYLESNYFNHHAKAAVIFQYCAEFSKEYKVSLKLDKGIKGDQEYFIKQAHSVENKFCQDIQAVEVGSDFNLDNAIAKSGQYKEELDRFRNTIEQKLKDIELLKVDRIEQRSEEVKNIYSDCTRFFVNHYQNQNTDQAHDSSQHPGLVQRLLKDCYKQLEPIYPEGCEYAIVGLGSLALGTMNPWSDLEFAVLINEEKEEYKEYFRNLTKLLWIKVINLQETPLSALGVEALNNYSTGEKQDNWFNDNLTQKAFRFDPVYEDACKSPLGRQGNYKVKEKVKNEETGLETETTIAKPDYELIMTPEQMLVFQHEEVEEIKAREEYSNIKNWFEADKHLSQALQTVFLIDGSPILLKDYREKLKGFQSNNPELHRSRALELLNEDVGKFSLKLGDKEEGKLLDAKQTIYRLGDRIVSALAGYHSIAAKDDEPAITVWQIIDKMKAQGILSDEGAKHLSEAIGISTELRIRTYSHNKGRYDNISTYEPVITDHLTEEKRKELVEKTFHFKDMDILKHFYYVMLRVQDLVQGFCDENYHNLAGLILSCNDLLDDSNYTKGMIHARFLEYTLAIKYLEAAREEKPDDLNILEQLAILYKNTGNIEGSFSTTQTILELREIQYKDNPNHPNIATSYYNHGNACLNKGNHDEAIKYHIKALKIILKVYELNPIHPDIASNYNSLGNAYLSKSSYDEAIEYYKKALNIRLKAYETNLNHPVIAMSYNNLGNAYLSKSSYDEAIEYYKKALKIKSKVYEAIPNHSEIAHYYANLGNAYFSKASYDEAIKHYNSALEIELKAYASLPNHPSIAITYNNLGCSYSAKENYNEAIKYHDLALNLRLKAYEANSNHPAIAMSYNNLGNAYYKKGNYDEAIKYHNLALSIRLEAYAANPNHSDISMSYNNLGIAYLDKENYDEAIEYYKKVLEIDIQIHEFSPYHPDIAKSYNNLGEAYRYKGSYGEAIGYYKQALDIMEVAYAKIPSHPDIAKISNNLNVILNQIGGEKLQEYSNFYLTKAESLNRLKIGGAPYTAEYIIELYNKALLYVPENTRALKGEELVTLSYDDYKKHANNPDFFEMYLSGSNVDISMEQV